MKLLVISVALILLFFASIDAAKSKSFGGKYAHEGQFPFVALMSYNGRKYCGASIIHERWVMSAAHCLRNDKIKPLITVGTVGDLGSGTNYEIEKFYIHTDYTLLPEHMNNGLEYVVNDIGLIRLKSKIIFNDIVQPIPLSLSEDNQYKNATATLMGWGSGGYGERMHPHLRYITIPVLSFDECKRTWTYAKKHLCTSNTEHKGACYGDSGSPVVVDGILVGLLSTVDTFCQSLKPDLSTHVGSFIPWINNILRKHGDELPVS